MNRQFFVFMKAYSLESVRNSVGLFFTVFFPVVFLLIFGFVFSGESSYRRTIGIYTDDAKIISALEELGSWDVKIYHDDKDLLSDVQESKIPIGVTTFGTSVSLYYQNNPSLIGEVKILELSLKGIIEKTINSPRKYIDIDSKQIQQTTTEISDFDYMMMGVIALSLFSNGMFSIITVFGNYRKKGTLRRLTLTGVEPIKIISSVSFVRLILSFLSLVVVLMLCSVIFKSNIQFNWFLLVPTVVFVTIGMMAIGVLLLSVFKNTNAASNAASILNTVMVFFSGVYFPINFMPSYIRWIAYILPVKYAADLVRYSANAQAMSTIYFVTTNIIFLVCGVVALWFSAKIFMKAD
ncbi:ABC transporter permease [Thermotoga profunda]|uniref:ABC transporter permease n=1 Tax=Thermotoga profunda TaxID=1508420 RepID=UPI000597A93F|nr:ABC transporter permease [Thermotoga profunda]